MTTHDLLHAAMCSQDEFVVRVVRYLAGDVGVRQFLDVGSGIADGPLPDAAALQIVPTARVLSVPEADLTNPAAVLEAAADSLELTEPVAVFLTGVLHLVADVDAVGIVSRLTEAVATESQVVVSHLACDIRPREMAAAQSQLNDTTQEVWQFRNRTDLRNLLTGLDLVEPGVVQADEWRPAMNPNPPLVADGQMSPLWVAVGRKP